MMGKDRYRQLTTDLGRHEVPCRNASAFSKALYRRTRCQLAWHLTRKVFVVFRHRGTHIAPQTYFDIGRENLPLNSQLLNWCVQTIWFYEAKMHGNTDDMLRICERRMADQNRMETEAAIEDRRPEFMREIRRVEELLSGGRTRYFDMAASGR